MSDLSISTSLDEGAASATAPCPLNGLPPEVHEYIHLLEQRITKMEQEQNAQRARLLAVGKTIFKNPMTKMFMSAMPKEMQKEIEEAFSGNS